MSLGGPALAVMAPAMWALLLIVGFALIYYLPKLERIGSESRHRRTDGTAATSVSSDTWATTRIGRGPAELVPVRHFRY